MAIAGKPDRPARPDRCIQVDRDLGAMKPTTRLMSRTSRPYTHRRSQSVTKNKKQLTYHACSLCRTENIGNTRSKSFHHYFFRTRAPTRVQKVDTRPKLRRQKLLKVFVAFAREWAALKEDNGPNQRTASRTCIHYEVEGPEIALRSTNATDHVRDIRAIVTEVEEDRSRFANMQLLDYIVQNMCGKRRRSDQEWDCRRDKES